MRISDWSSDVCSSDLLVGAGGGDGRHIGHDGGGFLLVGVGEILQPRVGGVGGRDVLAHRLHPCHVHGRVGRVHHLPDDDVVGGRDIGQVGGGVAGLGEHLRSEEHTSELQSLLRISYAVFCLQKKSH